MICITTKEEFYLFDDILQFIDDNTEDDRTNGRLEMKDLDVYVITLQHNMTQKN